MQSNKRGRRVTRFVARSVPLAVATGVIAACATEPHGGHTPLQGSQEEVSRTAQAVTWTNNFQHPGVINTAKSLNFVRGQIALGLDPWKTAFNQAMTDAYGSTTYADNPAPVNTAVQCGSHSSPDVHCLNQRDDAAAAYTQALLWYLAPSSVASATVTAWGNNAAKIMNDWSSWGVSSTSELIQNSNAVVQAAWVGSTFAAAAEILRYGGGTGSAPTNPSFNATNVETMFRNQFVPLIKNGAPGKNGNWETSCANSMIQIGAYLSDSTVFNTGISLWNGRAPSYSYLTADGAHPNTPASGYSSAGSGKCSPGHRPSANPSNGCDPYGYWGQAISTMVDGVGQETCRDFEHQQMGLDALFMGAETSYIQSTPTTNNPPGIGAPNLFKQNAARLTAALEFEAKYLVAAGAQTSASTYASSDSWLCNSGTIILTTSSVINPLPAYEIAYNEYANVEGFSLPNTQQLITANRGGKAWTYDHTLQVIWETLSHAGVGDVLNGCTPLTVAQACTNLGKNCGNVPDGCGNTLSCGSCTSPATCGGTGVANVCGTACTPKTQCTNPSTDCGVETDGCGGTIQCTHICSGTTPDCGGDKTNPNTCAADSVAPSPPTSLTSANVTSGSVGLQFSGASDDESIASYQVWRASTCTGTFSQIGTSTTPSYTDTTVAGSTSYCYEVYSVDSASPANVSPTASPTLSITTPAACVPATCGSNNCGLMADGCGGAVQCSTTCSTGVCGGGVTAEPGSLCTDQFDSTSGYNCSQLNTCAADATAPTVPAGLQTSAVGTSSITLAWTASADNIGVTGYDVYRSTSSSGPFTQIGTSTTTSYTDSTVASGTYYYTVAATDAASNLSAQSSALTVCVAATCGSNNCGLMSDGCGGTTNCGNCTTANTYCASGGNGTANVCGADTTPPTVPTGLTANTSLTTNSSTSFTWTASSDTINGDVGSGVAGYKVYRGGTQVGSTGAATAFTDTALAANTQYSYTVAAFDVAGNVSAQSTGLNITTLNNTPTNVSRAGWKAVSETYAQFPQAAIGQASPANSKFSMGASQVNGQYWMVDLGAPVTFRQIHFFTPYKASHDFPTVYNVDVSDDGHTWTNVAANKLGLCTDSTQCTTSGSGAKKLYPTTTPNVVNVSSMTHRYIKITLTCGVGSNPSCTASPHGGYWAMGDPSSAGNGNGGDNGFEVQN
jgi:fibronectin type 3 domain-containing protein